MANWEILEYNPDRVQTGLASAYSNTINGNNTKLVEVINNIDNKDYVFILSDPFACNQIIKALVSYYNCPESLQTKYDDLVAVLLDHIMQFQCMSQDQ